MESAPAAPVAAAPKAPLVAAPSAASKEVVSTMPTPMEWQPPIMEPELMPAMDGEIPEVFNVYDTKEINKAFSDAIVQTAEDEDADSSWSEEQEIEEELEDDDDDDDE